MRNHLGLADSSEGPLGKNKNQEDKLITEASTKLITEVNNKDNMEMKDKEEILIESSLCTSTGTLSTAGTNILNYGWTLCHYKWL